MPLRLQPEQLIVLICMRSIDQPIVPIRLRSTDRPIDEVYVQPLSPPDARTALLPESDNCRANTPAIPIMVVPISLQPKHDQIELYSLKIQPRRWHRTASVGIYGWRLCGQQSLYIGGSTHKERTASVGMYILEYMDRGYAITYL